MGCPPVQIPSRQTDPGKGWLIATAGIPLLLLPYRVPVGGNERLGNELWRNAALLAFVLIVWARHYFQVDADSLLTINKRAVVLFLRSFADDTKQGHQPPERTLLDFSLETRLSHHFMRYGPFVAIGSPHEKVPQIGAARVLLGDDEWQETILAWITEAQLIVMYTVESE